MFILRANTNVSQAKIVFCAVSRAVHAQLTPLCPSPLPPPPSPLASSSSSLPLSAPMASGGAAVVRMRIPLSAHVRSFALSLSLSPFSFLASKGFAIQKLYTSRRDH